jgi:hypothetical protein
LRFSCWQVWRTGTSVLNEPDAFIFRTLRMEIMGPLEISLIICQAHGAMSYKRLIFNNLCSLLYEKLLYLKLLLLM